MVTLTCVFIVAYSAIIPTWMALGYHSWKPRGLCAFITTCPPWATVVLSCHTFVLMIAISFVYQRILHEALRIKRQIHANVPESLEHNNDPNQSQTETDATRLRDNLNVIKNFAIIVGTSFSVWLPHAVVSTFLSYQPLLYLAQKHIQIALFAMATSQALIPVLNPIIYATRLKWFKQLLRYVIGSITFRECEQSMSDIWPAMNYIRLLETQSLWH